MSKDTRAIIIAIVMATVAIIGINKTDISELRAEIRELRGLLINHISGHAHVPGAVVPTAGGEAAETD